MTGSGSVNRDAATVIRTEFEMGAFANSSRDQLIHALQRLLIYIAELEGMTAETHAHPVAMGWCPECQLKRPKEGWA